MGVNINWGRGARNVKISYFTIGGLHDVSFSCIKVSKFFLMKTKFEDPE